MKKHLAALALAGVVAAWPLPSFAQQSQAPAMAPSTMNHGKAIAIGVGAVLGAWIITSPMYVSTATLVGAAAGGVLGAWWYNEHAEKPAIDTTRH
jgi:predicted MFS family arabinose efflux permease